eukprot:8490268-Pyramimonas_sp.AAC.1
MAPGTKAPLQVFTTNAMTSQGYRPEAQKFEEAALVNPEDYKNRIRFLGKEDGDYQMKIDKE